jgi:hypothetical protein
VAKRKRRITALQGGLQRGPEPFLLGSSSPFAKMSGTCLLLQFLSLTCLLSQLFHTCLGDVGTAASYSPPYLRKYPHLYISQSRHQFIHSMILHNNFLIVYYIYSHGMLWKRPLSIPIKQFVCDGR